MMDKTININLGGTLFQIDEEAFRILRDYLQSINNHFRNVQGGLETIEDIESRIAEIFQSQKGLAGVISKENVDAMIAIIGRPEDFDDNESEPGSTEYTAPRKRIYRNPNDTIIGGVCGGIGAYLNTDPVLFRILFAISVLVFGVGFFIYLVLWIAIPQAHTDAQKREMYGNSYHSRYKNIHHDGTDMTSGSTYNKGYDNASPVSNALNEVFRAIGKIFYVIVRIFLIITGVTFVLTGFLTILSFVMFFVFKYPGAFSTDAFDMNLFYFPDFLNYIVNPVVAPWIIALTLFAVIMPMLALIYWGVKMIFWFKAKDGIFSLICLVLWVISIAILALVLFNEGISFAETARSSTQKILSDPPETLYVMSDNKVSDLNYDKQLSFKEEGYTVFINEGKKELYIRSYLNVIRSDDDVIRVRVRKRSSGRSTQDALDKTGELLYNYSFKGDTLLLDEYFTIPAGRKWAVDNVGINLYIPEGTILKCGSDKDNLFQYYSDHELEDDFNSDRWESRERSWRYNYD